MSTAIESTTLALPEQRAGLKSLIPPTLLKIAGDIITKFQESVDNFPIFKRRNNFGDYLDAGPENLLLQHLGMQEIGFDRFKIPQQMNPITNLPIAPEVLSHINEGSSQLVVLYGKLHDNHHPVGYFVLNGRGSHLAEEPKSIKDIQVHLTGVIDTGGDAESNIDPSNDPEINLLASLSKQVIGRHLGTVIDLDYAEMPAIKIFYGKEHEINLVEETTIIPEIAVHTFAPETTEVLDKRSNFIPEKLLQPAQIDTDSMDAIQYQENLIELESQIRIPSLFDISHPDQIIRYTRNGYSIVGYQVSTDSLEDPLQSTFTTEESLAIRTYLAAQYSAKDRNYRFYDPEIALKNRFLAENEPFFRSGDIVVLVLSKEGQILSHLGIEGPVEEDDTTLLKSPDRTNYHYVEKVFRDALDQPLLYDLLPDNTQANAVRELRRFSIRHNIASSYGPLQKDDHRTHTEIRAAEEMEKFILALETVRGLTMSIPHLLKLQEKFGTLYLTMDTEPHIRKLAINGLLGVIPRVSADNLKFETATNTGETPFISLSRVEAPYNELLRPRYIDRNVQLHSFTLDDVIRGLNTEVGDNGLTKSEAIDQLLDSYAKQKSFREKKVVAKQIKLVLGEKLPLVSELIPSEQTPTYIADLV